ncbi:metalloregulator ArsR/SmtB family transcription factor [Glutamicibacter sp. MNS18]|uniref:ArsR/SmtB family transcription factor n=1 Tax=Glutamicibacter sp. MNS18 TaxID=2989817 RepID=UPI002235C8C2|nr:metalloregulator ArsR/SmtB family transcription factor [Glutamicibacter sp. MNS18]MCW4466451.1 metalloregulator ArsR/SmtB family transcription factor [Glutamicibacter sp. MNS18]
MAIIESNIDEMVEVERRQRAAALFHCLADPMRLMILEHLRTGEHKVRELTEHLGLAQSTVSAHLACLREGNLVKVRAAGRSSFYSLCDERTLDQILRSAQPLFAVRNVDHQWHDEHVPNLEGRS